MFYPIPCAKAWNSALPNSRIESRFSPKLCSALATVQPCLIHCLMPKPGKAGFYKALCRFGNGTALSYPLPYAKARNSALPNSRIESRFSPKLCVALAPGQPCLIHCLMPKPGKAGVYKALFRFGNGTAVGLFFFQTQAPVKSQAHKAGVKKNSLLREPYILQFKIFKSLAGFFYRFPVSERTEPYKALSRGTESNPRSCNHMALA